MTPKWWLRVAALCEVVGIFFVSILLQRAVLETFGLQRWKVVQQEMLATGDADFLVLARLAAQDQLLRYGFLFALAYGVGWWHRRRRPAQYGLTLNRQPVRRLALTGVVLWAGAGILPTILLFASRWLPIGKGPDHWTLFPDRLTWEFLVFMAMGSFLLVPLVEELAARGYMQTRLIEDFGPPGGVVLTAFFFTIAHTQYFRLEILSLGLSFSLALGALLLGYVFFRTGSLLPPVLAHAFGNLPLPDSALLEGLQIALMITVLFLARHRIRAEWPTFAEMLRGAWIGKRTVLAAIAAMLLILALAVSNQALALGLVPLLLLIAIFIESRDRRAHGSAPRST